MFRGILKSKLKGHTLVELIIAIGIFGTLSVLIMQVYVNVTRIQGRIALENEIYEDARFMMERIARSIRNNTIDYEEYFNKGIDSENQYGDLYGCYAMQFYNPGKTPDGTIDKLGAICNDGETTYTGQENCVVYKPSIDLNTGKFPYIGASSSLNSDQKNSTAFCPKVFNSVCNLSDEKENFVKVKQLYLIDKDGRTKTIIAQKKVKVIDNKDEYALGMLKLEGQDKNNDGITERWRNCSEDNTFCCSKGFDCSPGSSTTLESTLSSDNPTENLYKGFLPISPLRSNVVGLNFMISPVQDPRKAFGEGIYVVAQPQVTIFLMVRPSQDQLNKYGNFDIKDIPSITLQTTVSSRIQSEVKSYMGRDSYSIGLGLVPPPDSKPNRKGGYCPEIANL